MTSKALFLSKVPPRLLYRHEIGRQTTKITRTTAAIEVWTTTCIVMNFGQTTAAGCTVLINPANPQLSGVAKFPYFPRGGPVPIRQPAQFEHHIMGHVSQWGGMEVGQGMLFPVSVVDGLVHAYGGWHLQMALKWHVGLSLSSSSDPCPTGTAVRTTAGQDKLGQAYKAVVHTAPPFFRHPDNLQDNPAALLHSCYKSALDQLEPGDRRVATPLLGAGCRGFPMTEAMEIAVQATQEWCEENDDRDVTVAFAMLEDAWAEQMIELLINNSAKSE